MSKKIWVVEDTSKPNKDRPRYFVRASEIMYAHAEGKKLFGGVSFTTREPNDIERQIAQAHKVIEAK